MYRWLYNIETINTITSYTLDKNSQMKINYLIVLPMSVEERKCFKQIWNTNMNEDRCFISITLDYANLYENYSGYLYSVLMKYLRVTGR